MKYTLKMFETYPEVIGVVHLCKMLGISRNTAYNLLTSRQLRSVRIGKKYAIPKAEVIRYFEDHL